MRILPRLWRKKTELKRKCIKIIKELKKKLQEGKKNWIYMIENKNLGLSKRTINDIIEDAEDTFFGCYY